jgi:hypothetical protein
VSGGEVGIIVIGLLLAFGAETRAATSSFPRRCSGFGLTVLPGVDEGVEIKRLALCPAPCAPLAIMAKPAAAPERAALSRKSTPHWRF